MARAVARFTADEFFVAWALERYRTAEGLEEEQLASFLECPPEHLARLAMCRRPLGGSPRFSQEVQAIAAYVGANPFRLAALLRRVETTEQIAAVAPAPGFFAAARDRAPAEQAAEQPAAQQPSGTGPAPEPAQAPDTTGQELEERHE
jgi:hypothetical protein